MKIYVYFKANAHHDELIKKQMQIALKNASSFGLPTLKLERRPEAKDGLHTWMEIYEFGFGLDPDQLITKIEQLIATTGLLELVVGKRSIEVFTPIDLNVEVDTH